MTVGNVSPLLNAFEVGIVVGSPCPIVDSFQVDMAPERRAVKLLNASAEVCEPDARAAHRALCAEQAVLVAARLHTASRAAQGAHAVDDDGLPAQRFAAADHRRILEASRTTPIQSSA